TTTISRRPATAACTPVAVAPGASESLGSLAQASSPAIASPVSRARSSGLVRTMPGRIPRAASRSPTARAWSRPSGVSRRSSSGSPGAASAWRTKKTRISAPSSNTCRLLAREHAAPEPTLALSKAASLGCERVRPLAWCSRPRSSAALLEGALVPQLTILEGSTFCICDDVGDIDRRTHGFYSEDTRFLSALRLRLNDARPLLLSSGKVEYFSAAFFLRNPLAGGLEQDVVSILRERFV